MPTVSAEAWEQFLRQYPNAHLLQTAAWGQFKSAFGWQVERVISGSAGAQILFRPLPLGFHFGYIAKGPVGPDWSSLWPAVDRACRKRRALILKVEPDCTDQDDPALAALLPGFRPAADTIQPRRTVILDLTGSEEDILARMKQKTRYNIRLADKKDVIVRPSGDLDAFYDLMATTGARDGFGVHSRDYFRTAYETFHPGGACELLLATYGGLPLAALMVFARGERAWYFYGASNDEERNRMPAYLLQWEAIRWARQRGCTRYDLWGVPDAEEEQLEANFLNRSDGLWGVYRFKRGFGGALVRSASAWEKAYLPGVYGLYRRWAQRRKEQAG